MKYTINDIYNLLKENKFEELLQFEDEHRKEIINNPLLKNIFDDYFIQCFVKYLNSSTDIIYSNILSRSIYSRFIHHRKLTYSIKDNDFDEFIKKYIQILSKLNKLQHAYNVAKKFSYLNISKNIIDKFENENPINVKHSVDDKINISHNNNISKENFTINLFKSIQESTFFYSIIDYYPNFMTYPNVSLSCLIDFKKIEEKLNINEKEYFFKAVIDCVVFKQDNNNFIPKYFFELDSIYHDKPEQKEKDIIKDKILGLAGQKLFRIRAKCNQNISKEEFRNLIEEVIKE